MRELDTLPKVLRHQAASRGQELAFVSPNIDSVSYLDLEESAILMAMRLGSAGIHPGDRVGLYLTDTRQILEYIRAYFGLQFLGAVPALIPFEDPNVSVKLAKLDCIIGVPELGDISVECSCITLDEVLRKPVNTGVTDVTIKSEDPAQILFTSGTTGKPKPVLCSHGNLVAGRLVSLPQFLEYRPINRFDPSSIARGTPTSLIQEFDPELYCKLVEEHKFAQIGLLPVTAQILVNNPPPSSLDLESVRFLRVTGGRTAPETARQLCAIFPNAVLGNFYGATEILPAWTCKTYTADELRSVGPLLAAGHSTPYARVEIVDVDGASIENGKLGEVRFTFDPWIPKRQLLDEACVPIVNLTNNIYPGDMGVMDSRNGLTIHDRRADFVDRGVHQVSFAEVEAIVLEHPHVVDAAAVHLPHELLGEDVGLIITTSADLDSHDIQEFCAGRMDSYKIPALVVIVDEVPRGKSGKIDRTLARQLVGNHEQLCQ